MKTGTCKYGTSCKYHHPKERRNQVAVSTVGPLGLPLRPGEPVCNFYTMYGSCKYGSACKYDHPQMVGYYNYNYNYAMPALSIQDPSVMFPNQRRFPSYGNSTARSSPESRRLATMIPPILLRNPLLRTTSLTRNPRKINPIKINLYQFPREGRRRNFGSYGEKREDLFMMNKLQGRRTAYVKMTDGKW
ncbi:Zinc finger CCCH domain-containing protein 57, partial [Ananas comosus]